MLWYTIYPRDMIKGRIKEGILLIATKKKKWNSPAPDDSGPCARTTCVFPRAYAKVSMLSSSQIPPYPREGPTMADNFLHSNR